MSRGDGFVKVCVGEVFRVYDLQDWFDQGAVIEVNTDWIKVDFDDWIQQYPVCCLREIWVYHERVLVPFDHKGITVSDFRQSSCTK